MRFVVLCVLGSALKAETAVPAFDSVLTMLQNLVSQIETEEASDEQDYNNFMAWFTQQQDATSASISMLTSRLQELGAIIADLTSRKHALTTEVARLNGEIDETQSQINAAKDKRTQEHDSFVKEQLDFENSIKACNKAVELLIAHYGDGTPKESTRPAWMSFLSTLQKVQTLAEKRQSAVATKLGAFMQTSNPDFFNAKGSTLSDKYEGKTGEALSIVDQVKGLAETFAEDKQSSIDQEQELTAAFNSLMKEKTEQLALLVSQRDEQQAVLNQVSQELSENQNAEATAKATLQDEQTYLSTIQQQERDTTLIYGQRQQDRADEKQAVSQAISVLSQEGQAASALLQERSRITSKKAGLKLRKARLVASGCPHCHEASQMLTRVSQQLHSELLATAAMTTGSGEALTPVIAQLTELISRLDQQQAAEQEHKDWCEKELSETAATKAHHEMLVEQFKGKIEETNAVIAEKQQSIADTAAAIEEADKAFAEITDVRKKAKADFEVEQQDYRDAITALNQAIDILADFYREKQAFVQEDQVPVPGAAARADVPQMQTLSGGYQKKGGARVVDVLKTTRVDFETGLHHLQEQEKQEVKDYEAAKDAYNKSRADLVEAGNRFNAELQGAQLALAQYQTDLADNQDKVVAATTYLAQVGGSCNVLIENFAMRTKLRNEEKQAITDAVNILQSAV